MFKFGGYAKSVGGASTPTAAATATAKKSAGRSAASTSVRRKLHTERVSDRVAAGSLATANSLGVGSILATKAPQSAAGRSHKAVDTLSTIAPLSTSAPLAPPYASASLLTGTVHKKSSLSRKIADASKAGKAETRAPRKVKFSANLHTCPSSTSSKKSARIGELQVKKRPKKLKQGQRTRKEGGVSSSSAIPSAINLRAALPESQSIVHRRDIQQHGLLRDVAQFEPSISGPSLKTAATAKKSAGGKQAAKPKQGVKKKAAKKVRIKAGAIERQAVATVARPLPRLAYSIQPQEKSVKLTLGQTTKRTPMRNTLKTATK